MTATSERLLTEEQESVAFANPERLTLVQAGAGTGKTHTLIARIAFLAEDSGLDPGDDLLVLSFSRAAIGEVRKRLASHPQSLPFVPVQTFDSFATGLLDSVDPDGAWINGGYDDRIRAATDLLETPPEGLHEALSVRHILIDEAQDLVGVRARFVTALLSFTGAAFTVFTDAAQAIYGFSSTDRVETDSFVEGLVRVAGDRSLDRRSLTVQQRAASPNVARVMEFGTVLTDGSLDSGAIASSLGELVESLPPAPDLRSLTRILGRRSDRITAILCRSNAQVLRIAEELTEMGIVYRLQRQAGDRAIGPWLARVAQRVEGHVLSQRVFDEACADLSDGPGLTAAELWVSLRRMDPRGNKAIDLRRIAAHLRCGDLPEELNQVSPGNVVVSTIHRAKGLEFDRVLLVPATMDDDDQSEANRILYVGLSRAREEILVLRDYRPSGLRAEQRLGRIVEGGFAKGRRPATGVEMIAEDTNAAQPAGASVDSSDPVAIQSHLLGSVTPGDQVQLVLASPRRSVDAKPFYLVLHEDVPIGETSETFGDALQFLLPPRGEQRWPANISGVRVQMVDTVAGDETIARSAGLSRSGLWARVRLQGLGRFSRQSGDPS